MKLIFNNEVLSDLITITKYDLELLPEILHAKFGKKNFIFEYVVTENAEERLQKLASILDTNNKYAKLFFENEEYYYNAKISKTSLEHLKNNLKKGKLEFQISEDFRTKERETTTSLDIVDNSAFIENKGTYKTYPHFKINFLGDTSYLHLLNLRNNKSIKLGATKHFEDITKSSEYTIFDTYSFLEELRYNLFSSKALNTTDFENKGIFKQGSDSLEIESYNQVDKNKFSGANVAVNVPDSGNFRYKALIDFSTLDLSTARNNRLEFIVQDSNDDMLANIQISCLNNQNINSIVLKTKETEILLSSNVTSTDNIKNKIEALGKWNDFRGYFEIEKMGDTITFKITKIKGADKDIQIIETVSNPNYLNQKARVAGVMILKYKTVEVLEKLKISDISFVEYSNSNIFTENLFKSGDYLMIDCLNSQIHLNNIEKLELLDISSDFFELMSGENEILVLSDNVLNIEVFYNERYLY